MAANLSLEDRLLRATSPSEISELSLFQVDMLSNSHCELLSQLSRHQMSLFNNVVVDIVHRNLIIILEERVREFFILVKLGFLTQSHEGLGKTLSIVLEFSLSPLLPELRHSFFCGIIKIVILVMILIIHQHLQLGL